MLTGFRRWPYKFVHALLRILLEAGNLNLQAHTPAESVSERDESGWITVTTARGSVRTRAVVHATNRWASHLLPEFGNIIFGNRATLASIKAPEGFIKHTGSQHWDSVVNVRGPQSQNEKVANSPRIIIFSFRLLTTTLFLVVRDLFLCILPRRVMRMMKRISSLRVFRSISGRGLSRMLRDGRVTSLAS